MERRKPFNIDRCLLFYNFAQVVLNLALLLTVCLTMFVHGTMWSFQCFVIHIRQCLYELKFVYERRVNFMCEPLDFTDSYVGLKSAEMSYCYLLLKVLDLFDTIFFVLRKRQRQISFLHVYHHVAILLGSWIAVSWAPGGHPWFFGLLNCFVHFIMYGYYFGSVYSPTLKQNLMVKKSITQMQIVSDWTFDFDIFRELFSFVNILFSDFRFNSFYRLFIWVFHWWLAVVIIQRQC